MGVYALLLVVLFTSTISTTKAAEVEGAPPPYEEGSATLDKEGAPPLVEKPLTPEEIIQRLKELFTPAEGDEFTEKVPKINAFFLKHSEAIGKDYHMQVVIKGRLEKGALKEFLVAFQTNFDKWGRERALEFEYGAWAGVLRNIPELKELKEQGDADSQLVYLEGLGTLAKDVRTAMEIFTKLKNNRPSLFDRKKTTGREFFKYSKRQLKENKFFPIQALVEHIQDLEKEIRQMIREGKLIRKKKQ